MSFRIIDLSVFAGVPAGSEILELSSGGAGSFQIPLAALSGRQTRTVSAGGTATITSTDYRDVLVSTTAALNVVLPDTTARQGVPCSIVATTSSPNITITPQGGQNIMGQSTISLLTGFGGITLWPIVGGGWYQK